MKFATTFFAKDLKINRVATPRQLPTLITQNIYTDHMLEIEFDKIKGWAAPIISPFHNLTIHPANSTLQLGNSCFDSLKAYREGNKAYLFRSGDYLRRLLHSFRYSAFPAFDHIELHKLLEILIEIDKNWIPNKPGHSLYIRPIGISLENSLRINQFPINMKLYIILSPVGPKYKEPIRLVLEEDATKPYPGGPATKCLSANYGPNLSYLRWANDREYQQMIFLSGYKNIADAGTMNLFVYWRNTKGYKQVATPKLDGTVFPGIIRSTVIDLIKAEHTKIIEKEVTAEELLIAYKEKRVFECFTTSTSGGLQAVKSVTIKGVEYTSTNSELSSKIKKMLEDIQYGRVKCAWNKQVCAYS